MTHNIGWECPVCHMGNAPFATHCGHCARKPAALPCPSAFGPVIGPGNRPQWGMNPDGTVWYSNPWPSADETTCASIFLGKGPDGAG